MMVIFTSCSDKNALKPVRQVLDSFAIRIGNDTWKTLITMEGLNVVKKLLKKRATKSMSVACHWMRNKNNSELLWIVGDRSRFNSNGAVPIATTSKNILTYDWKNQWEHMSILTPLVALSALFHDLGKTNKAFQDKLRTNKKVSDGLRHEWISIAILNALISMSGDCLKDEKWLKLLIDFSFDSRDIEKEIKNNLEVDISKMPIIAKIIAWTVVSHHKLPSLRAICEDGTISEKFNSYKYESGDTMDDVLCNIDFKWGYRNDKEDIKTCLEFENGILPNNVEWHKMIKKWASKALDICNRTTKLSEKGELRSIMIYARASLMLSDYFVSSQDKDNGWDSSDELFANTDRQGQYKQYIDEHLIKVCKQALRIVHMLPRFYNNMEKSYDNRFLKKKTLDPKFKWQDRVIKKITESVVDNALPTGWFIVNMASTGKGKTIANAKIMQALSEDESLRYVLATGLRTLTLQTGDEYRDSIGIDEEDLAVVIGSEAVQELHDEDSENEFDEDLLNIGLHYNGSIEGADFLDSVIGNNKKNKAFLFKPILVTTIDHLIGLTETIKGGRYLLPLLRLMSSDLIIDEVDDFNARDILPISRLVFMAGLLGRKVIISSATIPPDLAKGLFRAYSSGYEGYSNYMGYRNFIKASIVDEYRARIQDIKKYEDYSSFYDSFVNKRAESIRKDINNRKGSISAFKVDHDHGLSENMINYFFNIKKIIFELHKKNHIVDELTGKRVSFGCVRMIHVNDAIRLGCELAKCTNAEDYLMPIMIYHSRQILFMRYQQEKYLDNLLKRKDPKLILNDKIVRMHIDDSKKEKDIIFVVVATPVEEVGRDHDFDWGVIEPSSQRSIIQMAGRIRRHRQGNEDIANDNIAVIEYNIKGMKNLLDNKPDKIAFDKNSGGFENSKYRFKIHSVKSLLKNLERVDAVPRIVKPSNLNWHEGLAELEHKVMEDFNDINKKGAITLNGYLNEWWFLTGLPQAMTVFRESLPMVKLYAYPKEEGIVIYKIDKGQEYLVSKQYLDEYEKNPEGCWWIERNYLDALIKIMPLEFSEEDIKKAGMRYGEFVLYENGRWRYSDQYGFYDMRGE